MSNALPTGWASLEKVFTVEAIMTSCDDLLTAEIGTDISAIRNEALKNKYSLIPAVSQGQIIGFWYTDDTKSETEALTPEWLISRDTGIPALLKLFQRPRCLGLFVLWQQSVIGLVTPADLNKLQARLYIYHLIGELELAMFNYIRRYSGLKDPREMLAMVSTKRQEEIKHSLEEMRVKDIEVDPLQLMNLSELINIICKHEELRYHLGYESRSKAEKALSHIPDLRNSTMHTVKPLLLERTPQGVKKLQANIDAVHDALRRLSSL